MLHIIAKKENFFEIKISNNNHDTVIYFDPDKKDLRFTKNDVITKVLQGNEYQFRKVLHIKRPETYFFGCRLKFLLWDKKDVAAFNDLSKIVALEKRNGQHQSFVIDKPTQGIIEAYIDGSFFEKSQSGGYAIIIKNVKGNYSLHSFQSSAKSSSLIELEGAIKTLQLLKKEVKIRLITDSQYVRKGLTEWIIIWRQNNWTTASGIKVKNISFWKKFDKLCINKYIEFQYVKGHSQHFENSLADLYAKDEAKKLL